MDQHTFSESLAAIVLVVVAGISGLALWGRRHFLLGDLAGLLAFSGICFLFYGVYEEPKAYTLSRLCDGALKGMALPVLVVLGMLAVTHQFRPARWLSAGILWTVLLCAILLETKVNLTGIRVVVRLCAWSALTVFLWYLATRLLRAGEFVHAIGIQVMVVSAQVVAVLAGNGSIEFARNDMPYLLFETISASFLCVQLYYAVYALERVMTPQTVRASVSSIS
ncbi:hypothetical protein GTP23_06765 [Pseudoduganella sp. FT93W]|uniref:Uncharacterized protein n=1 Tax=Duganella fentianensis TaxID=2692177 RepID=A0A845HTK8_9BURK|nr:hypothetical protein [Duganella fentianensis]MYN44774.1 hypothetical protein [Duganella fentianensis]